MAKADDAGTVAKAAKQTAAAVAGKSMASGAKVAVVVLTGLTGAMGYLGFQFFNAPGADGPKQVATIEADKQPALIASDFAHEKARLTAGNDVATPPWASNKEPAPAVIDNPWSKRSGALVDEGAAKPLPEPPARTFVPETTPDRTFMRNTESGGFNSGRPPADIRPDLSPQVPAAPATRLPAAGLGNPTTNTLRTTSPSLPSSGSTLDSRSRPLTTSPRPVTSDMANSSPPTGQRMIRYVNPCCPNVVMCVPVNPCAPSKSPSPKTSLEPTPATTPSRLSREPAASVSVRPAHFETGVASNASSTQATEIVLPDDSYWTIAERVYGNGEFYQALQEYHLRRGVRRLEIGDELSIPAVATLRRDYPRLCPAENPGPETKGIPLAQVARTVRRLYAVLEGDTWRTVAARELGDPSRAREIVELNRAALDQTGELRVGMEIALPYR